MSTKFEQLIDLVVNEEMDKAHELFHEIVVEKSREIYENLIAEEAEDDVEEAMDDDVEEAMDDDVEESMDDDVEEAMDDDMDEGMDDETEMEDAYSMDSMEGDDEEPSGLEKTDDFETDITAGDEGGSEDDAMAGIKDAIAELEAAFAELEMSKGGGMSDMDSMGDEMPGDEEPDSLKMGFAEGKRMTREYVEKVGNDWDKNSMKSQGQYVGAGTGDKEGSPVEGRSPIASGKNKPGPAGVNAGNLVQGSVEGQSNTGTSPGKVSHGVVKASGEKFDKGQGNVPGAKMGVKNLSKVAGGHGAEKKGAGPGPVGSGTGDKAGQTSIDPATSKQFLKPYSK
jgi:hypothetical protein